MTRDCCNYGLRRDGPGFFFVRTEGRNARRRTCIECGCSCSGLSTKNIPTSGFYSRGGTRTRTRSVGRSLTSSVGTAARNGYRAGSTPDTCKDGEDRALAFTNEDMSSCAFHWSAYSAFQNDYRSRSIRLRGGSKGLTIGFGSLTGLHGRVSNAPMERLGPFPRETSDLSTEATKGSLRVSG